MAAKAPAEEWDIDGTPVRLSSPDKVYFPQLGPEAGSKRALVTYYRAVAGAGDLEGAPLLAALRDRPTYLQRFPDGIEGEEIYQKRVPARHPDFVSTCRVTFPSGRAADALRVTGPAEVVWAANLGTFTFHPWPSRCPDVDHPDELRLDLDPQPGTDFDDARTLALEVVRPVLDRFGLTGLPKTSGGRGLHIYIRIRPNWEIAVVRRAAIALAREIAADSADRATVNWWKEERGERIFIDYNQNARDRTIASAYSARRTPNATVSTPVTWDELVDVDPDDCTIATVPDLLARRGDPMSTLDDVAHDLSPVLELIERHETDGLGEMPFPPNYPKMPGEPKRVQPSRDTDRQ